MWFEVGTTKGNSPESAGQREWTGIEDHTGIEQSIVLIITKKQYGERKKESCGWFEKASQNLRAQYAKKLARRTRMREGKSRPQAREGHAQW